jgi:hypothetical protein
MRTDERKASLLAIACALARGFREVDIVRGELHGAAPLTAPSAGDTLLPRLSGSACSAVQWEPMPLRPRVRTDLHGAPTRFTPIVRVPPSCSHARG